MRAGTTINKKKWKFSDSETLKKIGTQSPHGINENSDLLNSLRI